MDLLRFITAGSVDDGKSTLIGRLLYDSKNILIDQMEAWKNQQRIKRMEKLTWHYLPTDCVQKESRASRSMWHIVISVHQKENS
jgi:sulfate adenylyltransferase subunit 1 (EFTu-like GTPase family)